MTKDRYIEFIGVPGAGKTAAAKLFVSALQKKGVDAELRRAIGNRLFLKLVLWFKVQILVWQMPSLRSLRRLKLKDEYRTSPHAHQVIEDLGRRFAVEVVVVQHLLSQTGTLVNDEGLIGKAVALMALTNLSREDAASILRAVIPSSTALVFIDAPIGAAMEREAARDIDLPFFDDLAPEARRRFYEESAELYRTLTDWLSEGNISVLRVQNSGKQRVLAGEVERLVTIV